MRKIRRLLIITLHDRYSREVVAGIHAYCGSHGAWEYHYEEEGRLQVVERSRLAIREWKADGIIAQVGSERLKRLVVNSRLPAVNFSGYFESNLPTVITDNVAMGRAVARHFLDNGCRRFAFCARTNELSPRRTCEGFVEELSRAGYPCQVFTDHFIGTHEKNWVRNRRRMDEWLRSLPKPVAIMCSHEPRAQEVSWACQRAGLHVPDDVALMCPGIDELRCRMCTPPLSSIHTDAERIGYEAARLLDGLIRGRKPPRTPVLIPPGSISARRSSDMVAVDDSEIAAAIRFIREHAHEAVSVKDLLSEIPISRRSLERRFEKAIGRTPKSEIMRIRIERAKELLAQTDQLMSKITTASGFSVQQKFSAAFRRETGLTPTEYRRSCRVDSNVQLKSPSR